MYLGLVYKSQMFHPVQDMHIMHKMQLQNAITFAYNMFDRLSSEQFKILFRHA